MRKPLETDNCTVMRGCYAVTLWAPYDDALRLILTGSTNESLSADQQGIFEVMLMRGLRDEMGNLRKERHLDNVQTRQQCHETHYYIPDLFRYMFTVSDEWSALLVERKRSTDPLVNLDYLNSLKDEMGNPLFTFSMGPGQKSWEESPEGEHYWDLVCREIDINDELAVVNGEMTRIEQQHRPTESPRTKERLQELAVEAVRKMAVDQSASTGERPAHEGTRPYPLEQFRSMEKLTFQEVKFRIDPERLMLKISARGKEVTAPFSAIDITKKNEVTLNRQGEIFMAMVNGTFNPEEPGTKRAISRLSASLREAFNTPDPPFQKNRPKFRLSIPKEREGFDPSFYLYFSGSYLLSWTVCIPFSRVLFRSLHCRLPDSSELKACR